MSSIHACRDSEIIVSVSDFGTMSCKPQEIVISSAEWRALETALFCVLAVNQHARLQIFTSVIDSRVSRALYPTSYWISLVNHLASWTVHFLYTFAIRCLVSALFLAWVNHRGSIWELERNGNKYAGKVLQMVTHTMQVIKMIFLGGVE